MNNKLKSIALLFLGVLYGLGLQAQNQNLVVTLTNSSTETFAVSGIRSIKFGNTSMTLYELNGTVTTWQIADIDNYAFDDGIGIHDQLNNIKDNLNIFPNPASENINFVYESNNPGKITIDIIDGVGRQVQVIYQGDHEGEQQYSWTTTVQAGVYYCRIVTETKVTIKPIVIK